MHFLTKTQYETQQVLSVFTSPCCTGLQSRATKQAVHTTSFPRYAVSVYIGLLIKNSFFVNFPSSDFWGLLMWYRGHVPGPKTVKKPSFAISGRLADFSRLNAWTRGVEWRLDGKMPWDPANVSCTHGGVKNKTLQLITLSGDLFLVIFSL